MRTELVSVVAAAFLLFCLGWACFRDLKDRKIPNATNLLLALGGIVAAAVLGGTSSGAQSLLGIVLGLAIGAILFKTNLWGGGDAKMLAAAAAWVGPGGLIPMILWTMMFGGLVALGTITAGKFRPPRGAPKKATVPYGLAIAAGTLLVLVRGHASNGLL